MCTEYQMLLSQTAAPLRALSETTKESVSWKPPFHMIYSSVLSYYYYQLYTFSSHFVKAEMKKVRFLWKKESGTDQFRNLLTTISIYNLHSQHINTRLASNSTFFTQKSHLVQKWVITYYPKYCNISLWKFLSLKPESRPPNHPNLPSERKIPLVQTHVFLHSYVGIKGMFQSERFVCQSSSVI